MTLLKHPGSQFTYDTMLRIYMFKIIKYWHFYLLVGVLGLFISTVFYWNKCGLWSNCSSTTENISAAASFLFLMVGTIGTLVGCSKLVIFIKNRLLHKGQGQNMRRSETTIYAIFCLFVLIVFVCLGLLSFTAGTYKQKSFNWENASEFFPMLVVASFLLPLSIWRWRKAGQIK